MPLPRLRPLLLPVEHGGWGFLCEPIVIGLVAAPSAAGWLIAAGGLGLFLARQPLKVAVDDWRHRRRVPRTAWALGIAAGYLALATAALTGATMLAGPRFWMVGPAAAPLAAVALWFDARGASRGLLPELAGATALGAIAGACALAADWSTVASLSLWAVALIRVLPAIVTVRERVQRLHGQPPRTRGPAIAHAPALLVSGTLALAGVMPVIVVGVAALLAARALWHLRDGAPAPTAMQIGVRELLVGLVAAAVMGGGGVREFKVQSSKFKVQSSKFKVQSSEFKVHPEVCTSAANPARPHRGFSLIGFCHPWAGRCVEETDDPVSGRAWVAGGLASARVLQCRLCMAAPSPARQRTLQLQRRTFRFMCDVLRACPRSIPDVPSRAVWQQLVRAAMGASGNLDEADEASSPADFVHRMKVALRETRETRHWLRALDACALTGHDRIAGLEQEAGELASIFATIVLNVRRRLEAERSRRRPEARPPRP